MGEQNNNFPQKQDNSVSGIVIAGFVLGIISWFLNFWGIVGILAIVFSSIALSQISRTSRKGKGLAIAGLVSGIINVIYAFIVLIGCFY